MPELFRIKVAGQMYAAAHEGFEDVIHSINDEPFESIREQMFAVVEQRAPGRFRYERTFDELKEIAFSKIDARSDEYFQTGFEFEGVIFSLSLEAQARMIAMMMLAESFTYPMAINSLDDNTSFSLENANHTRAWCGTAMGTVKAIVDAGWAQKELIRQATDAELVRAYEDPRPSPIKAYVPSVVPVAPEPEPEPVYEPEPYEQAITVVTVEYGLANHALDAACEVAVRALYEGLAPDVEVSPAEVQQALSQVAPAAQVTAISHVRPDRPGRRLVLGAVTNSFPGAVEDAPVAVGEHAEGNAANIEAQQPAPEPAPEPASTRTTVGFDLADPAREAACIEAVRALYADLSADEPVTVAEVQQALAVVTPAATVTYVSVEYPEAPGGKLVLDHVAVHVVQAPAAG
jgi:hypothetical protein